MIALTIVLGLDGCGIPGLGGAITFATCVAIKSTTTLFIAAIGMGFQAEAT